MIFELGKQPFELDIPGIPSAEPALAPGPRVARSRMGRLTQLHDSKEMNLLPGYVLRRCLCDCRVTNCLCSNSVRWVVFPEL